VEDGVAVVVLPVVVGAALARRVLLRLVGTPLGHGGAPGVVGLAGAFALDDDRAAPARHRRRRLGNNKNHEPAKERDRHSLFHGTPPSALVRASSGRSVTQYLRRRHVEFRLYSRNVTKR